MFKLLKEVLRSGSATVRYPFAPAEVSTHFRGKPEFDPKQCIACAACTVACPPNALSMRTDVEAATRTWAIDYGRCIFCGRCEEVCPTHAIALSSDFELAVTNRQDLRVEAEFHLASCRCCGEPFAPAKELDYVVALLMQAGLPAEEAEIRRAQIETCPQCRRHNEVPRVSGFGTIPQKGAAR